MYGMPNCGNLFADELSNWMIDKIGFNQSKFQISVNYKYSPDRSKLVQWYYADYCVYWYKYELLGKCFVVTLVNIFHVKFLGYSHFLFPFEYHNLENILFQWIKIDMLYILLQKYLDTFTIKENSKFHNTDFPHDMIFTK